MVNKESAAAEYQKSLERALTEKLAFQEEIEKLSKLGNAAGVKQVKWLNLFHSLCFEYKYKYIFE